MDEDLESNNNNNKIQFLTSIKFQKHKECF